MAKQHNTYPSIVPSESTDNERKHMRIELSTAKNWGLKEITINLPSGEYKQPVSRINDYK